MESAGFRPAAGRPRWSRRMSIAQPSPRTDALWRCSTATSPSSTRLHRPKRSAANTNRLPSQRERSTTVRSLPSLPTASRFSSRLPSPALVRQRGFSPGRPVPRAASSPNLDGSASFNGASAELLLADTRSGKMWPVLTQDRPVSNPTVSPDGRRIAYQSGLSQTDVIAVPLADGPVETVLGSFRDADMADASPATSQIAYITNRRGPNELWIASTSEGTQRPLLTAVDSGGQNDSAEFFMSPAFSRDGRRIATCGSVHGSTYVYTLFAAGG